MNPNAGAQKQVKKPRREVVKPSIKIGPRSSKPGESLKGYHDRLRRENENIKIHLRGRFLHPMGFINRKTKAVDLKMAQKAKKNPKTVQEQKTQFTPFPGAQKKFMTVPGPMSRMAGKVNRILRGIVD